MYVLIYTLTKADHMTIDEAKDMALKARGDGKGSRLVSDDEARCLFSDRWPLMQDLTQISSWADVK